MSISDHRPKPPGRAIERRHGRDEDYSGPERRAESRRLQGLPAETTVTPTAMAAINARFDRGSQRMADLQAGFERMRTDLATSMLTIEKLRADLAVNTTATEEVREILDVGKQGLRVLGWMGTGLMWALKSAGVVATAGLSLWAAYYSITHGGMPPKH